MPGFKILDRQVEDSLNVARPTGVIYKYTWDIQSLVSKSSSDQQSLIYLRTCTLPVYTTGTEDMNTGHVIYKIPKEVSWSDVKLSFYDTNGLYSVLEELREQVWTPEDGLKLANDYVANTIINVNDSENAGAYQYTLKNSWIKSVAYSELSYETSGINNVNVTVGYSWAESSAAS
ncbi:MAG: hypothetical protein V3T31_12260 [candidate division Zixibacteria bacterium]